MNPKNHSNALSLDDIFSSEETAKKISIDSGVGTIHDIEAWKKLYIAHLVRSGKSKNTIAQYKVTLNALDVYSKKYLKEQGGISLFLENVNDFLVWMEDYIISLRYGSIKERISHLLLFFKTPNINMENYLALAVSHLVNLDDEIIDAAEYTIFDFHSFSTRMGTLIISKESVLSYMDQRKTASNVTMEQRRIAVISFLKFIDKTSGVKHFEPNLWQIKEYKKAKHASRLYVGFNDEENSKIEAYLALNCNLMNADCNISLGEYYVLRIKVMIVLMKKAGLRASEATSLKFSDIEEARDGRTYVLSVDGKGNKKGRIPISKELFFPYLSQIQANRKGEYLSSGRDGAMMTRSNLFISVKTALQKIGVHKTGLHIFRHHFGATFTAQNGNIKILQQLLRHSNITTTMIYSTVQDEILADAVCKIADTER